MPVFTDGRLRPRLDADRDRPAGRGPRPRLPGRRRRRPARPDRARQLRRPPQRRGQLPGRQGRGRVTPIAAATALREAARGDRRSTRTPPASGSSAARRRFYPGQRLPDHAGRRRRRRPPTARRRIPAEVARILDRRRSTRSCPARPIEMVERTIGDWPLRYGGYRIDGLSRLGRDRPDPRPARGDPGSTNRRRAAGAACSAAALRNLHRPPS